MLVFSIVLLLIILMLLFTNIRIEILKFDFSNIDDTFIMKDKLELDYKIKIKLSLFAYITYLSITLDKEKMQKYHLLSVIKKMNLKRLRQQFKDTALEIKDFKKLEPIIEKFKMNISIGTEDVILTSSLVVILSILVSIILRLSIKDFDPYQYKYTINPLYKNKNLLKLELNCIIKVKLVHIIYVIFIYLRKKGGVGKNERTSHRRSNDDSHEQYTRHGRRKYNYR